MIYQQPVQENRLSFDLHQDKDINLLFCSQLIFVYTYETSTKCTIKIYFLIVIFILIYVACSSLRFGLTRGGQQDAKNRVVHIFSELPVEKKIWVSMIKFSGMVHWRGSCDVSMGWRGKWPVGLCLNFIIRIMP